MAPDEAAELRLLIQSNRGLIESLEDEVRRLESRSYEANRRLDALERQRDAAQGDSGAKPLPSWEDMRGILADPAPSDEREALADELYRAWCGPGAAEGCGVNGWERVADFVLAREAALRAQLAEREGGGQR